MISDIMDMDTKEKIRYVSESSNTSGYSTMSPGGGGVGGMVGNISPASSSVFSSPAQSPATALQADFSNMNLPSNSPQQQFVTYTPSYNNNGNNYMNPMVTMPNQFGGIIRLMPAQQMLTPAAATFNVKQEFVAVLRILEHPVEKFRFRYKSEMHGTHGSLNGASSKRTPKTFPEVELCNFNGRAVIRCSLFQTNLESPHSHQLVVRKDDTDICDPHDLNVSPEQGYVCKFQNMGIIHTAKKYILEELLKKKKNRLRFELGRDELSTKQMQELHKETEKEAKDMNLNQVRLCFEAFKVEDNNSWTRIAAPVYTNAINNRKSAQTGELRICRLSIATGSVSGGDDLILLVEKVSKKNIKVRFYEMSEDEDLVWEAFARFRESDVHHQYAIVCQTPAYRDKDIDRPVEVCIELVRPSDDERSDPPITFRYKPRDVVASRKRRRTCSTLTSSTSSSSSLNSYELPKTIQEQTAANQKMDTTLHQPHHIYGGVNGPTISEEFKDDVLNDIIAKNSEELQKACFPNSSDFSVFDVLQGNLCDGALREDGISSSNSFSLHSPEAQRKQLYNQVISTAVSNNNAYLNQVFKIYEETLTAKNLNDELRQNAAKKIENVFKEFAEKNEHGDTIIHEIITTDNPKICIKTWHILKYFQLTDLLNRSINQQGQSGLHCACLYNRVYLVRPLLGLGCDPNIQDRNGNTALHIAVREQHQKCIESFLNMDSLHLDLNTKNDEGLTPLHLAIRQKDFTIAKKMLSYNRAAALVCNPKDGNNALHMAVNLQNIDLVKYILEAEQFRNILLERNAAGQTPMDLARSLATKTGNEILALLSTYSKDVIVTDMLIKEEDVSSSSTEDDEDSESADKALELVKVKEETELEEGQANDNDTDAEDNTQRLQNILNDEKQFDQLAKLLDAPEKWKKLAELCKMQHLLCLWSNSAGMLIFVKKNAQMIGYNLFEKALAEVDKDALNILLTI